MPSGGSHLQRYSRQFPIVEINTSSYRHHRPETYARWAASVGEDFRFSVKVPQSLTHEGGLNLGKSDILMAFLNEVAGLEEKLGALLVQLPPSLAFSEVEVRSFFEVLKNKSPLHTAIVCEPRHPSWCGDFVDGLLNSLGVTRVAADPARWDKDAIPGGYPQLAYFRLHGVPKIYYSDYSPQQIDALLVKVREAVGVSAAVWCIFDNTAHGHAISNALRTQRLLTR